MKILITGGAGFIGHHIIEHILKNTDWDIITLDRLNISGTYLRIKDIEVFTLNFNRVKTIWHDLRSEINKFVSAEIGEVDYILHLAASSHVDRSIEDPMAFVMDNVVGTTNMLNFARTLPNLKAFVYFSTDEVFGPAPEGTAYKEWDRYNSGNPYAAAKAGGEEMALAFANTYKLPVIITHTMNVFGERQHSEKFIPMCIKKILAGEKILIHANKEKTKAGSRYWIHGRNVGAAILFLLENWTKVTFDFSKVNILPAHLGPYQGYKDLHATSDKFNIVGEREVDNLEMARFIAKVLDKPLIYEMVDFHSSRPGHDLRYALDGSKMAAMGWKLPASFEESLEKTIKWTIDHPQWLKG